MFTGKEREFIREVSAIIENNHRCVRVLCRFQQQYKRGYITYKGVESQIDRAFRMFIHGYINFRLYEDDDEFDTDTDLADLVDNVIFYLTQGCLHEAYIYRQPGPTEVTQEDYDDADVDEIDYDLLDD